LQNQIHIEKDKLLELENKKLSLIKDLENIKLDLKNQIDIKNNKCIKLEHDLEIEKLKNECD
jgi:hypothetical protein